MINIDFNWQQDLKEAVTSTDVLCQMLDLNPNDLIISKKAQKEFSLRVPQPFINRMQKGNPNDPLLRQVLPVEAETQTQTDFTHDPLNEKSASIAPGLLHKYNNRVLLTLSGSCAVNCRYCFRRHFPYAHHLSNHIDDKLKLIENNQAIDEVILSGGEPLLLDDNAVADLIKKLEKIPHLKTVRIHTRLPIVIPRRLTDDLQQIFESTRLNAVMVLHTNHPHEIGQDVIDALKPYRKNSITLLNQAVLLRGVNDDADTLIQLSHQLFNAGIIPYYLHCLDPVQGSAHFDVPLTEAIDLVKKIQSQLSGYLVPKLVKEIPGYNAKVSIPLYELNEIKKNS